jgi:hypothetical protein
MSDEIPKSLHIRVSREEVFKGIHALMEEMSKIRRECINSGRARPENIEKYLSLANMLATDVMAVSDAPTIERFNYLVGEMNDTSALVFFDPFQRGYWTKHKPGFVSTLDTALIQMYGEHFDSLDKGHHLIAAVKCVCARNEDHAEKKKDILASVLPVCGAVRGVDASSLLTQEMLTPPLDMNNLGAHLSFQFGGLEDTIRRAATAAQAMGYLSFQAELRRAEYQALERSFPGMVVESTRRLGGEEYVRVRLVINNSPLEEKVAPLADRLMPLLTNPMLMELVLEYAPEKLGEVAANIQPDKIHADTDRALKKYFKEKLPFVDLDAVELSGNFHDRIENLLTVVREVVAHPDIYGFIPGDGFTINEMVVSDDNEEDLWVGSEGEVKKRSSTLSIEFDQPKIKGRPQDKEPRVWDYPASQLKVLEPSSLKFPSWYKPNGKLEIGARVELTSVDEDEVETGDLNKGSIGRVIGFTYDVHFSKVVNKAGAVSPQQRDEDELNQIYLTRTRTISEQELRTEMHAEVSAIVHKLLSRTGGVQMELCKHNGSMGYHHREEVAGYDRHTILLIREERHLLLSYIREGQPVHSAAVERAAAESGVAPEGKTINPQRLVEFLTGYKGSLVSATERLAKAVNPIHLSLREIKEGKVTEYCEARK